MIHIHYFITRRPDVADAEFHRYWREVHGPIVARIPQLRRYQQTHRIPTPAGDPLAGGACGYDGAAEAWVDDVAALETMAASDTYKDGALADEPNFIDMARVEFVTTTDNVVVDGAPGAIKGVFMVRRAPGTTVEAFRAHWASRHAELGSRLPGLRRYVQCATVDAAYAFAQPRWDGVGHLWFDDIASMRAAFLSPEGAALGEDGTVLVDGPATLCFHAEEHVVIAGR